MSFIYFIIMIGVLVFVHEFGHFIIAKLFDVKVLRFSIGFGPKIIGFHYGETEYVICALPLGGYVQMLGHDFGDLETVPEEDRDRALMAKPIWQRSLVILAGPVANLLLPLTIFFFAGLFETTTSPLQLGQVFEGSPAAVAGLQPGDKITAMNGEPVRYWHDLPDRVADSPGEVMTVTYERDGESTTTTITPETRTSTDFLGLNVRTYGMIGVHLGTYGPTIAFTAPDVPGAQQGLQNFDRVVAIDGKPVRRFDEIEARVRTNTGAPMTFSVLRLSPIQKEFGRFYSMTPATVTVTPALADGQRSLGLVRAEMVVSKLNDGSAAHEAGIRIGDRILSLDGKDQSSWGLMIRHIHNRINEQLVDRAEDDKTPVEVDFKIEFIRAGQRQSVTLRPDVQKFAGQAKTESYRINIGWGHMANMITPDEIEFPLGERMLWSAKDSVKETTGYIKMMVMGIVRMAQGRVGLDSLGGPILIGELAAQAGEAGIEPFLRMMALISINLAIFNFVPIPVLDGGQLALFAIEAIKRGPLSFRTRQIAAYIGFAMVVMVMVLAFKNDIERNWDKIVDFISVED